MTTINQVLLVAPIQLSGSDAAYYTAPPATSAKIGRAVFCNTDTGAHQITINIVAAAGSSGAANEIIAALSIAAGTTYVSPELAGAVLPPGTMLRGLADTGSKVTMMVSGLTIV